MKPCQLLCLSQAALQKFSRAAIIFRHSSHKIDPEPPFTAPPPVLPRPDRARVQLRPSAASSASRPARTRRSRPPTVRPARTSPKGTPLWPKSANRFPTASYPPRAFRPRLSSEGVINSVPIAMERNASVSQSRPVAAVCDRRNERGAALVGGHRPPLQGCITSGTDLITPVIR